MSSTEIQNYNSFLPFSSCHVTINPLKNVHEQHKHIWQIVQHKLEEKDTSIVCVAENLKTGPNVIVIEVEFKINDHNKKVFDNIIEDIRSSELQ